MVFSPDLPIDIYRVCASIVKRVDTMLRANVDLDARERNNLRFYIAMQVAALATDKATPTASDLADLDVEAIAEGDIEASFVAVKAAYDELGADDRVAKGRDLVTCVIDQIVLIKRDRPA